uniref:Phosphodiesterase n=2 Tax=Timema TaxID=61471 RepID=A0A7R9AUQ8_TIMSH|nr:unnamed protein product [Timema shepardi]
MDRCSDRVIFFTSETESRKTEEVRFHTSITSQELKELFRSAAEAGPYDILKLLTSDGQMLNITPSLPSNSVDSPHQLKIVAIHCQGMVLDGMEIDLSSFEERVSRLEKQLIEECHDLPPAVHKLKTSVDDFRDKLEKSEHLSWLGWNFNVCDMCVWWRQQATLVLGSVSLPKVNSEAVARETCFYKESPAPLFTESYKNLQYRRKNDVQKQQVWERFLNICEVSLSEEVRRCLRQPSFDCCQWEDEEILVLLQQMYLDLDFLTKFNIDLRVLRNFLFEVYTNYNEIPFHNFKHCFCVAQMMYAIVWTVDLTSKIGDLETMILLTSCICHDLDHPGYNNIYQINAKTELALRYNDISPLENHHCSVAFRILENPEWNIFQSLKGETFRQVREGIIRCILATDMARHNEILAQFKDVTPEFDFNNKIHTNLLSMILIKVADISNEARPMDVAEPWLDKLLQEFFKQSDAEKLEGLPVTPFMDRDKITKPSSQCSFIGFVLLPLFEALGDLFTELQGVIVQPVRDALDYYRRLNDAAKDERLHRKSVVEAALGSSDSVITSGESNQGSIAKSVSTHSVKSRRSLSNLLVRARSRSVDDDDVTPEGVEEMLEQDEEDTDQTVTEVEVSEKTLKFKISTEGSITGGKSYPGSRKGSKDKSQLHDYTYSELAKAIKDRDKEMNRSDSPMKVFSRVSSTSPVSSHDGFLMEHHEEAVISQKTFQDDKCNIMIDDSKSSKQTKEESGIDISDHGNSPSTSYFTSNSQSGNDHKAMTLPKVKKSQRHSQRRWRAFLGGSKSDIPTSSPELMPSTQSQSPSFHNKRLTFHNKRNSCSSSSDTGKSSQTTLKFELQQSDCLTNEQKYPKEDNCGHERSEYAVHKKQMSTHKAMSSTRQKPPLTGSLDSVLQDKTSTGNNNNHKKTNKTSAAVSCSPPEFSRLDKTDVEDTQTSKARSQPHGWISSIASSFRTKKSQVHENSKTSNTLPE